MLSALRTTSHVLLALPCVALLTNFDPLLSSAAEEFRTTLFVQAGTTLLGLWVVNLKGLLAGGGEDEGAKETRWLEGTLGLASWAVWTAILRPLTTLPSSPTRAYLLWLASFLSFLSAVSTLATFFQIWKRDEKRIELALDDNKAMIFVDEKLDASETEEEDASEMVTESSLFLGLVLGGSMTCLLAASWMTRLLGYSPAILFFLPSLLGIPILALGNRHPFPLLLTSFVLLLQYYATVTFTLSHRGAPTCGLVGDDNGDSLLAFESAPLLCALSRSLYYASWLTLAGLVARLFGLHLAARGEEDEDDQELVPKRNPDEKVEGLFWELGRVDGLPRWAEGKIRI